MNIKIRISKKNMKISILPFLTLVIASLMVLIPALSLGVNDESVSIFFYIGSLMIILIMHNIWILIFYYLIIALNMYLMYVPLKGLGMTVTSVVYLAGIFGLLLCLIKHKFFIKQKIGTFLYFYIFVILSIVIYAINAYVNGTGVGEMIWKLSPLYLSLCLVIVLKDHKEIQDNFIFSIVIAASIIMVVAYIELIQGSTFFYHLWTNNGERYRNGIMRVGSTLGDPNTMSMYLVPSIFLLFTHRSQKVIGKKVSIVLALLMIIIVILSSSRASLLAFILGLFICLYFNEKSAKKLVAIIASFILIALLPYIIPSFYNADVASSGQRIMLVFKAIAMWKQHKIFGIGLDNFLNQTYWMTMNEYVKQIVEFGILGFGLYIGFYFIFIIQFIKSKKYIIDKKYKEDSAYIFAALIAFAFNSFSMDSYFHYIMWIFPPLCFMFFDKSYYVEVKNIE